MNFVYSVFARILPTRSVDAIVSVLVKVAERLARAEADQLGRAAELRLQAADLQRDADEATANADRAGRVRANLAALTA